jgi:hypothetical protein
MTTKFTTDNGQRTTNKQDWRLYAAAGAAALAAGSAADAAIITGNLSLDVKLPGPAPFRSQSARQTFAIDGFKGTALVVNHITGGQSHFDAASAAIHGLNLFRGGSSIPAASKFTSKQMIGGTSVGNAFVGYADVAGKFGNFAYGQTGLAGFRLPNGDLGSLRVEVLDRNNDGYVDELKVLGYAYNDTPGQSLTAGSAGQGSVPEPSALGLLAMGSAGVLAWRRRAPAR